LQVTRRGEYAFEAKHAELDALRADGADPEDPGEYRAETIFWVPPEARWSHLKGAAPQVDDRSDRRRGDGCRRM
jgi:hypothetical protein